MLLRLHSRSNSIPARAQSALIALLYVFLCTFGMVTHTHAPGDSHQSRTPALQESVSRGHRQAGIGKATLSPPAHCAFCDWQANSHARTVAVWQLTRPQTFVCVYTRRNTPVAPFFTIYSSSRAPPIA